MRAEGVYRRWGWELSRREKVAEEKEGEEGGNGEREWTG